MGRKVLAAKSGRAACSCAAAGGGIAAKNAKSAKSFSTGLTGFTGLREVSVKPAKTKPSGVAWIGDILDGWEVGKLGSLYTQRNEKVSDKVYPPLSVTMKGIVPQLATAAKSDDGDNRKLVRKGDFAINSRSDRRGSCGISEFDGSVSLINTILTPRGKMNPVYYNWLFHTEAFADEFYKWGHGIVDDLWTTRWSEMKRMAIVVPPLPVQRAIAAYLDEKCGTIDAAVAEAKKGIEEYKAWKKSLIFEVVTGKLRVGVFNAEKQSGREFSTGLTRFTGLGENLDNPVNPVKTKPSGVSWIGDVPEGWKVRRLKSIFEYRKGLSITKADLTQTGIPVISYGQIHSKENTGTHLQDSLLRFVPLKYLESDGNCLLKEDDFVFADTSEDLEGLGNCVYVDRQDKIFAGYHTIIFRPYGHYRGEVKFRYLAYLFKTDVWRSQFRAKAFGIKVYSLSQRLLNDCCLILPPLPVQRAIAAYLDEKCAAIDKMVAEKEALIADLEAYKKSLIYEIVTGKREVASNSMVK